MGNSAEDVHVAVVESAAGVVVPTYVEGWHVVPKVQVYVVLLSLLVGFIFVATGARDN